MTTPPTTTSPLVALMRESRAHEVTERAMPSRSPFDTAPSPRGSLNSGIEALVALLRDGGDALVATALLRRAQDRANTKDLVDACAVDALIDFACRANNERDVHTALLALGYITAIDNSSAVVQDDEPVGRCVGLVRNDEEADRIDVRLSSLRECGAVSHIRPRYVSKLVSLLYADVDGLVDRVAAILVNLSLDDRNQKRLVGAAVLPALLELIRANKTTHQTTFALCVLRNLSTSESLKTAIVDAGAVAVLVALLTGKWNDRNAQDALVTLWNLTDNYDATATAIRDTNAISVLVRFLSFGGTRVREAAAGALWSVALSPHNKALVVSTGAIEPLVELVQNGTPHQMQNAAGALCSLAVASDETKRSIAKAGGIEPLAALAQEGRCLYALWAVDYTPECREDQPTPTRTINWEPMIAAVVVAAVAIAIVHTKK